MRLALGGAVGLLWGASWRRELAQRRTGLARRGEYRRVPGPQGVIKSGPGFLSVGGNLYPVLYLWTIRHAQLLAHPPQ